MIPIPRTSCRMGCRYPEPKSPPNTPVSQKNQPPAAPRILSPDLRGITSVGRTLKRESEVLPLSRFSHTLKGMEVHFSPDVETQLQQVASANGKNAEQLVKDTVARMLENQARFIAGVQRGIEQADRGEFVEHKDVLDRIDRLFHS